MDNLLVPMGDSHLKQALLAFYYSCQKSLLDEDKRQGVQERFKIENDIPAVFLSLSYSLTFEEPNYHFKDDVMEEIFNFLESSMATDEKSISEGFRSSVDNFFAAISAYEIITEVFKELNDVAYETELKTRVFRIPVYTQIVENCLMNFYRCLLATASIISEKDYSSQNTLGKAIDALKSKVFNLDKSIAVNVNLRNSISHGNLLCTRDSVKFSFRKGKKYCKDEMNLCEFDQLIESAFDMSGGVLAGFIKFFSCNFALLEKVIGIETDRFRRAEWLKIAYRSSYAKAAFIEEAELRRDQLNIDVQSKILDKDALLFSLLKVAKGFYLLFPSYQRYLISYNHYRSPPGFLAFDRPDFEKIVSAGADDVNVLQKTISKGECLFWEPQTGYVDERAYNFHSFSVLQGTDWHLSKVKDCSISGFKRIKANLIIEFEISKKQVKSVLAEVISELRQIRTPQNPHEAVPYGDHESDAVFVNVFTKSVSRRNFNLFPKNRHFICSAMYYKNSATPRLTHGGVPENLWKSYKKENWKGIKLAWNPKFKLR